ncbi:MAG TPA: type II secretion system F family protein, partial [Gemmatimonadales bacterium]|nr:type II secretion system F family protein [Gemmatimonadales bacterium]
MSPDTAFAFKALRRDGTLEAGVVEAPSRDAAAALISSQGAFAIELSAQAPHAQARLRVSAEDLALGLRALGTLLNSGVPLARALAMMDDLAPPTWRSTLPDVRRRVEQGQHLAAALDASALPLPPHVMGIIEAGEAGSGLARAVDHGAQLLETRAATRAALRGALAYPSILAAAGSASVTLLVVVVLPRFANLLVDTGQALPATTRLVLALASIAHAGLIPALMLLSGMVALWRAWVGRPEGVARWHRLLLDAPAVGPIRR